MQKDNSKKGERTKSKTELQAEANARQVKKAEELKGAARRLFSTKDGVLVAKAMKAEARMYPLDGDMAYKDEALRAIAGRQHMYVYFIKGLLLPEQIMTIETPDGVK